MYRIEEPRLGGLRIKEWRRRAHLAVGLLLLVLLGSALGIALLDHSDAPLSTKMFTAVWDAVNLISTLGDFSEFNADQKIFMLGAILATMLVAGYALSQLTGMLSGDDVMVFWENRAMENKLETLSAHVAVCPFGPVGQQVAAHLRDARASVLVLETDVKHAEKASGLGYMVIVGDLSSFDDVLGRARLDTASALFVTGTNANSNLEITLVATRSIPGCGSWCRVRAICAECCSRRRAQRRLSTRTTSSRVPWSGRSMRCGRNGHEAGCSAGAIRRWSAARTGTVAHLRHRLASRLWG
ncbi:NAD-binding protein [Paraburkholderia kirstenboschensis]|uniref:NAD-binding protein n=1 Tax=Paraburkholderia kirstenboschensis TaxID=1245436 RepID=A0ABZ0EB57_9BURK|nr:NAD-binding protein [Paraburkholderia kirstenboschensis]WOD13472.1 NAD-binding protein [Paraburkholderia kirstenboschensis]